MRKIIMIATILVLAAAAPVLGIQQSVQQYFDSASVEYLKGDYRAAYKDLSSALALDPKHPASSELMKFVMKELGRTAQPQKASPDPALIKEYISNAKQLYLKGEYLGSMFFAGKAYFLQPNNEEALIYFSNSRNRLQEYEQRRTMYFTVAAAAFITGFIGLALLLSFVSITVLRTVFPGRRRPENNRINITE